MFEAILTKAVEGILYNGLYVTSVQMLFRGLCEAVQFSPSRTADILLLVVWRFWSLQRLPWDSSILGLPRKWHASVETWRHDQNSCFVELGPICNATLDKHWPRLVASTCDKERNSHRQAEGVPQIPHLLIVWSEGADNRLRDFLAFRESRRPFWTWSVVIYSHMHQPWGEEVGGVVCLMGRDVLQLGRRRLPRLFEVADSIFCVPSLDEQISLGGWIYASHLVRDL